MNDLINRIIDFNTEHRLIERGDRVLLSLSAGKDSMFLLDIMMKIKSEYEIDIGIFHLNHMLRGAGSDLEERHVAGLSARLGLALHLARHDFSNIGRPGASFEEAAREKRYHLLDSIAASGEYTKIATAHNRNDMVETVLMRIFTGTGIHGLMGIPARRGNVVRPVLCVSAAEIYEYLAANSIEWREDPSNRDTEYSRNFIRNVIIPTAAERFPMVCDAIHSLGEVSAEYITALNSLIDEKYPALCEYSGGSIFFDASRIASDRPLFYHAISRAVRDYFGRHVDRSMLRIILEGYHDEKANRRLYENKYLSFEKVFDTNKSLIRISPAMTRKSPPVQWEYRIDIADAGERDIDLTEAGISARLIISDYNFFMNYGKNPRAVFVTLGADVKSVCIRNRRLGDTILTESGTKKIKDLLIGMKLHHEAKNRVPIMTDGAKIIAFMPGLLYDVPNRISRDFLVDKKSEKVLAVITKPDLMIQFPGVKDE